MKKILIVEDDALIQDLYKLVFSRSGYTVTVASDGEVALTKIGNEQYDMILLDVRLPKVTGIDVLKKIRNPESSTVQTPVFLITNLGQEDIVKEAFVIGANGYLIKSQMSPKDVVAEVEKFLKKPTDSSEK